MNVYFDTSQIHTISSLYKGTSESNEHNVHYSLTLQYYDKEITGSKDRLKK